MSERLNDREEDIWAELEYGLLSDSEFAQQVGAANDELDMADLTTPSERHNLANEPYYLEDVSDVADVLYDTFVRACQAAEADIHAEEQEDDTYDQIGQEIIYACMALKKRLFAEDVIASDRGIYVDARERAGEYHAFTLEPGEKLVGRFVSPIIGRLPDEAYYLAKDSAKVLPVGVGLRIEEPLVMTETGEAEERFADDSVIVIPLGIVGLRLEKFHFRSDLE